MLAADIISDVPAGVIVPLVLFGIALWLALIRWTHTDARRRLRNPGSCAARPPWRSFR